MNRAMASSDCGRPRCWCHRGGRAPGVTGSSDPGGSYCIGVGIRDGIAEGPRMTTVGQFITTSNGISAR